MKTQIILVAFFQYLCLGKGIWLIFELLKTEGEGAVQETASEAVKLYDEWTEKLKCIMNFRTWDYLDAPNSLILPIGKLMS